MRVLRMAVTAVEVEALAVKVEAFSAALWSLRPYSGFIKINNVNCKNLPCHKSNSTFCTDLTRKLPCSVLLPSTDDRSLELERRRIAVVLPNQRLVRVLLPNSNPLVFYNKEDNNVTLKDLA